MTPYCYLTLCHVTMISLCLKTESCIHVGWYFYLLEPYVTKRYYCQSENYFSWNRHIGWIKLCSTTNVRYTTLFKICMLAVFRPHCVWNQYTCHSKVEHVFGIHVSQWTNTRPNIVMAPKTNVKLLLEGSVYANLRTRNIWCSGVPWIWLIHSRRVGQRSKITTWRLSTWKSFFDTYWYTFAKQYMKKHI
jgi:hypothetical protein